jgi:hypothetical protein
MYENDVTQSSNCVTLQQLLGLTSYSKRFSYGKVYYGEDFIYRGSCTLDILARWCFKK